MLDTATGRGADASAGGGQRGTYTYRWETLLSFSQELPSWLAAHKGVNPTGDDPVAEADVVASLKGHPAETPLSPTRRNPGCMGDQLQLAKELAAAAEPCFDTADRLAVYSEMNLGAHQYAIDEVISAVLRKDHPMPAGLIDELKQRLAGGPLDRGGEHPDHLVERVARVRTR